MRELTFQSATGRAHVSYREKKRRVFNKNFEEKIGTCRWLMGEEG